METCDARTEYATAACAISCYTIIAGLSRLLMPFVVPKTYARLAEKPGARGYWESSVAATLNGMFNPVLAVLTVYYEPAFFTSPGDSFYLKTQMSCTTVTIFTSWIFWELGMQLMHWGKWPHPWEMMIHHISALLAWGLYIEGGYAHGLNLVGLICEFTNPFANMRYFLSTMELKSSRLYLVNGLAFLFSWILVRLAFAIPMGSYVIWAARDTISLLPVWRAVALVGFFGIGCCLNCMWGYKLIMGAIKVLRAGEHSKEE